MIVMSGMSIFRLFQRLLINAQTKSFLCQISVKIDTFIEASGVTHSFCLDSYDIQAVSC